MKDWNKEDRADWIAELSDPYKERRDAAVEFLRHSNRYCLDRHSRPYRPLNGHTPQAMVQLRTRL